MLPILQRRFRALENSKSAMLDQLSGIPAARLNERPSANSWSAAELISHVANVEREVLEAVKHKMAETDEASIKLRDRVGSLIVRNVMRAPLRVKVPAEVPGVLPDENANADQAMAEWQSIREQWRSFLEHARGPQLKSPVFAHPKGAWFTLPETVLFLRLHHDHHRAQIGRIARALSAREPVCVA
ncbi:DinB family protein [Terriglobus aquaticus]|nr:DinB family protein [Terriglobus aquaticus]